MENVRKIFRNAVSGLCSKGTELKREPRILSLVRIILKNAANGCGIEQIKK